MHSISTAGGSRHNLWNSGEGRSRVCANLRFSASSTGHDMPDFRNSPLGSSRQFLVLTSRIGMPFRPPISTAVRGPGPTFSDNFSASFFSYLCHGFSTKARTGLSKISGTLKGAGDCRDFLTNAAKSSSESANRSAGTSSAVKGRRGGFGGSGGI